MDYIVIYVWRTAILYGRGAPCAIYFVQDI